MLDTLSRQTTHLFDRTQENIVDEIHNLVGVLPQVKVEYEAELKLLWVTLRPEPKPVFTLPMITSLRNVQRAVMSIVDASDDAPILFLAYRGPSPIYSLGGDLDYYLDCLRANDREALREYAHLGAEGIGLNISSLGGRVITLSTVAGRALGGGIDPARACNVMVAEEQASFGYPEVHFNHFPISAVPVLSRHTGDIEAERILMSGADFTASEFLGRGALDAVVPQGTGEDWLRDYARKATAGLEARIALFAAFNRRAGKLDDELRQGCESWVDHIMGMKPLAISKLQRIAAAQERMLSRRPRSAVSAPG